MSKNQPKPRGWKYIEELSMNASFIADVEEIRKRNEFSRIIEVPALLKKYKIPTSFNRVIYKYVESGEIDSSLTGDYAEVDASGEGVSLKLSFDINKDQLLKYIEENWSSDIEPGLNKKFGPRESVYANYYPTRDKRLYEAYVNRKKNGVTIAKLMYDFGISKSQLYKAVRRQKGLIEQPSN